LTPVHLVIRITLLLFSSHIQSIDFKAVFVRQTNFFTLSTVRDACSSLQASIQGSMVRDPDQEQDLQATASRPRSRPQDPGPQDPDSQPQDPDQEWKWGTIGIGDPGHGGPNPKTQRLKTKTETKTVTFKKTTKIYYVQCTLYNHLMCSTPPQIFALAKYRIDPLIVRRVDVMQKSSISF